MSDSKIKPVVHKESLPSRWVKLQSRRHPGKTYYYNTVTKCSLWEKPSEVYESFRNEITKSCAEDVHSLKKDFKISFKKFEKKTRSYRVKKKASEEIQSATESSQQNFGIINPEIEDYCDEDERSSENFIKPTKKLEEKCSQPSTSGCKLLSEKAKDTEIVPSSSNSKRKNAIPSPPKKLFKSNSVSAECLHKGSQTSSLPKDSLSKTDKKKVKDLPLTGGGVTKKKDTVKSVKNTYEEIRNFLLYGERNNPKSTTCDSGKNLLLSCATKRKDNELDSKSIICSSDIRPELKKQKISDYDEEMDWEPFEEKLDSIKVIDESLEMDATTLCIPHEFLGGNFEKSDRPFQTNICLLIFDTNIYIMTLDFIMKLRDFKIEALGNIILYVPWCVLQELDHLKNFKESVDNNLSIKARKAISYLNENFKSRHPMFFGQSYEDFSKVTDKNSSIVDDQILQTCLSLKNTYCDKKVVLITNDKNLESKALVSNLEVYSKDSFEVKYLLPFPKQNLGVNISTTELMEEVDVVKKDVLDNVVREIKNDLREFLSSVLQIEMEVAFEKDWIKVCFKKPPWTLENVLDCFKKHWRSVFFLIFDKTVLTEIEKLYFKLCKSTYVNEQILIEVISITEGLLWKISKTKEKERLYLNSIDSFQSKITKYREKLSENINEDEVKKPLEISNPTTISILNESNSFNENRHSFELENYNQAKDLFCHIWDSIKNFCESTSEMISSPVNSYYLQSFDSKLKLMQRHDDIVKLIILIEKVFEMNFQNINEFNQNIVNLSNFLIQSLSITDKNLKEMLPKNLAVFFSNTEGRALLVKSLSDFKEFSSNIMKAIEYIDRGFCAT